MISVFIQRRGLLSAVDTLARLASTGRYTATQLQLVAETSQQWTHVMGDGADKIESAFSEIGKSPVQALASLNSSIIFVGSPAKKYCSSGGHKRETGSGYRGNDSVC
ncbi:Prophage tail length tape measure protein [Salmonella enterica]|uniref:Prophage tail length tape measure protein n=1 Tax=Salmonella enterica TaxID=28901 RepID=A0A379R3T8_SALER|nr:Prophage tail length tape measure protein [Salmonella enterica]